VVAGLHVIHETGSLLGVVDIAVPVEPRAPVRTRLAVDVAIAALTGLGCAENDQLGLTVADVANVVPRVFFGNVLADLQ
jgi:hypothetical protein